MLERLRITLVIWYAAMFGVFVLLFGAGGMAIIHLTLRRDLDATLVSTARLLETSLAEIPRGSSALQWQRQAVDEIREIAEGYALAAFRVQESEEGVVRGGRFSLDRTPAGFSDISSQGQAFRVYSVHLRLSSGTGAGPGATGNLEIAMSTRYDGELTRKSLIALGFLSPLLLGTSIAVGLWLAGRAIDPVQKAFDRLEQFTADVSHELRTPIAIVQAEVDVGLAKRDPSAGDLRRRLERIGQTTDRMARLVGDLLIWVRQDSGNLQMAPENIRVVDVFADVAQGLALLHPAVRFVPEAPPTLACRADPLHLRQALFNLADNAAHHSPAGTEVQLRARHQDGRVLVEVSDRGTGIAPDLIPHLFERFFRAGDRPGMGLGLAISQAILKAHGSSLQVSSGEHGGTRFWFELGAAPDV